MGRSRPSRRLGCLGGRKRIATLPRPYALLISPSLEFLSSAAFRGRESREKLLFPSFLRPAVAVDGDKGVGGAGGESHLPRMKVEARNRA